MYLLCLIVLWGFSLVTSYSGVKVSARYTHFPLPLPFGCKENLCRYITVSMSVPALHVVVLPRRCYY